MCRSQARAFASLALQLRLLQTSRQFQREAAPPPIAQLQTCSISDLDVNLTQCNCAAGMAPPSTPVGSSGKLQGGSFRGPFSGPAQERYGSYLGKVLTQSNVATSQALAPWK